MKKQITIKRMFAIAVMLFAMVTTASADWTKYDASTLPGDAGFNVKNSAGNDAVITLVDDAENAGNKILQFISGSADKNTLEAPKFDSKVSGGGTKQAFTVVMRARAYQFSADSMYKNFMEVEVKDGEIRDKVRFYPEKGLDIEKANAKELKAYPEGHDSYTFNIYRVTFKDGITTVYINDVMVDQSVAASTTSSDSDSRFVIGDSNSSADYGIEYDWIIWDNGDAYAPGEGADYPEDLILAPLAGGEVIEGSWDIYDGSETPETAGFSAGGSNSVGSSVIIDDADNTGNKILDMRSAGSEKWYWSNNHKTDIDPDKGFTVVYRMSGITPDSSSVGEMEVCGGGFRDKIRIYGDDRVNIEKAGITVDFPEGISAMDFNVYRVTFQRDINGTDTTGYTRVWINDTFVAEGYSTTTSGSNKYTIGDSNSSKSYAALIDWIIREETGAYAPYESPEYPAGIVLDPLSGGPVEIPNMLRFDDMSVEVAQAGETLSGIGLEANAGWELAIADDGGWITGLSPIEGDSGVAAFSFQVFENTNAAPRSTKIYGVINDEVMDSLIVTQDGKAVLITPLTAIASSEQVKDGVTKAATNAIDGDDATSWVPSEGIVNGEHDWVKVAIASGSEVVMVKVTEYKNNARLTAFSVDYWNGSEYVEILPLMLSPLQAVANSEVAYALPEAIETDTVMFKFYGNAGTTETDPTVASGWLTVTELSIWGAEVDDTGVAENMIDFKVYPNPTSGSFVIDNAEGADVKLMSLSGKVMYQKSNIDASENVNLQLQSGLYLLKVGQTVKKIVVQ